MGFAVDFPRYAVIDREKMSACKINPRKIIHFERLSQSFIRLPATEWINNKYMKDETGYFIVLIY